MRKDDVQVMPEEAQAKPEATGGTAQATPEPPAKLIFEIGAYLAYCLDLAGCVLEKADNAGEFAEWLQTESPKSEGASMAIGWRAAEPGKVKLYSQDQSGSYTFTLMEGLEADYACIPFNMSIDVDEQTTARASFVWYPVEGKMSGADISSLRNLSREHPLIVQIREALLRQMVLQRL